MLDVPAANYGLLLDRSVDFDPFRAVMDPAYPASADQALAIQLIQMLWDRGEGNGYLQHLTADPYAATRAKQVLLHVAFGDHQVANIATEIEARTIGASVHRPVLADGRSGGEGSVLRRALDRHLSLRRVGCGDVGQRCGRATVGEPAAPGGRGPPTVILVRLRRPSSRS